MKESEAERKLREKYEAIRKQKVILACYVGLQAAAVH